MYRRKSSNNDMVLPTHVDSSASATSNGHHNGVHVDSYRYPQASASSYSKSFKTSKSNSKGGRSKWSYILLVGLTLFIVFFVWKVRSNKSSYDDDRMDPFDSSRRNKRTSRDRYKSKNTNKYNKQWKSQNGDDDDDDSATTGRGGSSSSSALDKRVRQLEEELSKSTRKLDDQTKESKKLLSRVMDMEHEKMELIEELEHHKISMIDKESGASGSEIKYETKTSAELAKFEEREKALRDRINKLILKIQTESHRELIESFGEAENYYVEFTVQIPEYAQLPDESNKFIIETAGPDALPHTVNLFLQQVSHELWNGASFIINAPHILQAAPHDPTGKKDLRQAFQDKELTTVSFQEYSPKMPHEKYTFGFAGRPAGPDFYINKLNNTINHGPGGQEHHTLEEEADPCFAKVWKGEEVLDAMFSIPVQGAQNLMRDFITISEVKVIPKPGTEFDYYDEKEKEGNEDGENDVLDQGVEVNVPV
eukprot:CAMPEP_0178959818 /NCGR_PEP_ID=MMETSP0789-20121207/12542_1 /TAXON_ID=3005 /ORGANISM="Rhizosolenia setigera, Strain CCMP 1694" /LENGTH=479 /DNA_ID=CAMNT_0020642943 /DNA_START=97 /DNA_END=1536 /DNA_ORIENTATION=+